MKIRRTIAVGAITMVLATLVPLAASAAEAGEVRDIGTYRVGARFNVRAHVGERSYNGRRHVVGGTVGLTNTAERPRSVRCLVVVTFKDRDGTARVKRDDQIRVRVGPDSTRHPDYQVQLRDPIHRYANDPVNAVGHCHLIG
ncbi:MAG: hypothetical protein WD670_08920 [Actinomycetota bacterium]